MKKRPALSWPDKAARSPELRSRLARGIRDSLPPGPSRLATLANIGVPAGPGDAAPEQAPKPVAPKPRKSRARARAKDEWAEYAEARRPTEARAERLVLQFPGLILRSENKAQRGNAVRGGRWLNLEANLATNEAREAWKRNAQPLWRFDVPVSIKVWQVKGDQRTDPGNLYKKALIDTLQERTGGLGIIRDDSRKYVVSESTGYATGGVVGVIVEIEPATAPLAASIFDTR